MRKISQRTALRLKRAGETPLGELVKRYYSHRVGRTTAVLTYYLVFSFFPLLIFVSAILGFLELAPLAHTGIFSLIPSQVAEIIEEYLTHIQSVSGVHLLIWGFALTGYSVTKAMGVIIKAVETAGEKEYSHRFPVFQLKLVSFTLVFMAAILFSLVLLSVGRSTIEKLAAIWDISRFYVALWDSLRFICIALIGVLVLDMLYRYGAGEKEAQVWPGVCAAMCALLLSSLAFAWYVSNMANYSALYGSLGAVIVLFLWLRLGGTVIIMGAELNALLYKRKR